MLRAEDLVGHEWAAWYRMTPKQRFAAIEKVWVTYLALGGSLDAVPIAVPSCDLDYLRRGHAVHCRCRHPEALRMRVDIMSKMRGVDGFAKKTQRDKEWPMIRRLVEANYFENRRDPRLIGLRFPDVAHGRPTTPLRSGGVMRFM